MLTTREQFAAMAMQGLLSGDHPYTLLSKAAVVAADALIAELQKTADPVPTKSKVVFEDTF